MHENPSGSSEFLTFTYIGSLFGHTSVHMRIHQDLVCKSAHTFTHKGSRFGHILLLTSCLCMRMHQDQSVGVLTFTHIGSLFVHTLLFTSYLYMRIHQDPVCRSSHIHTHRSQVCSHTSVHIWICSTCIRLYL